MEFAELARRATRVLIAVSDCAIAEVAQRLCRSAGTGGIALHTCGAKDESELDALRAKGFACGTIHPLQTIASPEGGAASLPGCTFAISGDAAALGWARAIARLLDGGVLGVNRENRALYHAAAAMASNHLVALADAAQQMLAKAGGVDGETAMQALAPLVGTTLANVLERGPAWALTGPIERGDAETVRRHLSSMPQGTIMELYRAAAKQTLDLARRKGLNEQAAAAIDRALKEN